MNFYDLTYRLADESDVRKYFEWANAPEVRQNSFSPQPISFEEHQGWFLKKLKSGKCLMLLYFFGADAVGQIRVDLIDGKTGEIDYSVDKHWRGKGIGTLMLQSINLFAEKVLQGVILKGVVLAGNHSSMKSFKRAGFQREEKMKHNNQECVAYYSK